MRTLNFYYIYDNIGECVIGDKPFFAPNDLCAAICFRDNFIKNQESKFNYKSLDLVRFAVADVGPDGDYMISILENDVKPMRIVGDQIMSFINEKMLELGIDDDFLEDKSEVSK